MEWLHFWVVRGSQKALAKKNRIKSLQNHTEPLKEELGLASIAGPLWNSVTEFLDIVFVYQLIWKAQPVELKKWMDDISGYGRSM